MLRRLSLPPHQTRRMFAPVGFQNCLFGVGACQISQSRVYYSHSRNAHNALRPARSLIKNIEAHRLVFICAPLRRIIYFKNMSEDTKNQTVDATAEGGERSEPINQAELALYEEMAGHGILFGRRHSKSNPKMKAHVHGVRAGFDIIDLSQTVAGIEKAQQFLKELVKKGQTLLVAATTPAAYGPATAFADKHSLPRVTDRWLGGTLSNFEVISKRLQHLTTLKADKAAGRLDKYTKKERVMLDKEIERLTKLFGGIEKMNTLPGALLVIGAPKHMTAIREAKRVKIPVIAIASTDTNPDMIDYLIPANDNSVAGISYILAKFDEAIAAGVREKASAPVPVTATKKA